MSPNRPIIGITMGDPAGVGPVLVLAALSRQPVFDLCKPVVLGDIEWLNHIKSRLSIALELNPIQSPASGRFLHGCMDVLGISNLRRHAFSWGNPTVETGRAMIDYVTCAIDLALAGQIDAMVTAPVHKGIINDAGFAFTGHTEFIAGRVDADPVMMLACPGLRVALATTHLPLREVSDAITPKGLETLIRNIHRDLEKRFGIANPVIFVCGLNPHAGEGGHLGREEIEVIEPVLHKLRSDDAMQLVGPLSADTLFTQKNLDRADAVLAMYHDQGLPVLKHMGFGKAVNITLGLPIIRTSVDHGTALELAGTGQADSGSLKLAIEIAVEMVRNSRNPT